MNEEEESEAPLDIDGGIFDNKEDVVGNIKSAAENVGLPAEAIKGIDAEEAKKVYYARRNCNWCCGRGMINYVPNGMSLPSARKKERSKVFLRSVNMTRRKLGESVQKLSLISSGKCRIGRDTRLPEERKDGAWRTDNITKTLCKCVRVVEEA